VCRAVHGVRGITEAEYAMDMLKQPKMSRIKSVVVPKNCRDIRELAWSLNPGSNFVLLPGIHGVYNTLVASSLFNLIEPPDNFQFEVGGYVVSHTKESYTVREECRQRTRLELLCYIGNAYFSQVVLVSGPTKNPLALHTQNQADRPPMRPGTHVQASLLVTSTNHVKAQDIIVHPNNKHIDITKLLADLHKLKRGEKLKTPVRVGPVTEKVELDENHKMVNELRGGRSKDPKEEASQGEERQEEEELDPEVLARREKQLDTFKRSIDYRTYFEAVPKKARSRRMPGTPEKKRKFSRRAWDGAIRQWKLRVHAESRKVMENSSKTGHHMVDSSSETRSNLDFNMDRRVNGYEKEQGVDDFSQNNSEGVTGTAGDIMEVKLEYKSVDDELLHPKEKEAVEADKTETAEKVKIITI